MALALVAILAIVSSPAVAGAQDRSRVESARARSWTLGGALGLGAGLLLGGGAITIGTLDPCHPRSGNSCIEPARTRAAWAMGAPALIMTAAGASLLIAGLVRRRALGRGLSFRPGIGGFVVSGRF